MHSNLVNVETFFVGRREYMKFISVDSFLKALANEHGFVSYNLHINKAILGQRLVLTKQNTPEMEGALREATI